MLPKAGGVGSHQGASWVQLCAWHIVVSLWIIAEGIPGCISANEDFNLVLSNIKKNMNTMQVHTCGFQLSVVNPQKARSK